MKVENKKVPSAFTVTATLVHSLVLYSPLIDTYAAPISSIVRLITGVVTTDTSSMFIILSTVTDHSRMTDYILEINSNLYSSAFVGV